MRRKDSATASKLTNSRGMVSWAIIAALLLLRMGLVVSVRLILHPVPEWLEPVFEIGTYILTAAFILWERHSLTAYHLDAVALAIIILFKPLSTMILTIGGATDLPLAFPRWPSLFVWVTAVALFVGLRWLRPPVPKADFRSLGWFGLGIIVGVVVALAIRVVASMFPGTSEAAPPGGSSLMLVAFNFFPYQIGYAGVAEEPLFRGFLWGKLRGSGWQELWIWIVQGVLFAIAHVYMLVGNPLRFWFIVPTTGLVAGLLVWRSRTLSSSMAAHAALNALFSSIGLGVP